MTISVGPGEAILPAWADMTQPERDAAYNNTAAVADVAALHAARTAASERTRAEEGARLDIRYGAAPRNLIDLFPAQDPNAPCLVFFHGGYWQMNSKETFACLGDGVRAHGWAAAFAGYSLAPAISLKGIVREVDAAVDFLRREGGRYGVTGPMIAAGWSAGGHLASLALRHTGVAGGLSVSGIHDLAPLRCTYLNERLQLTNEEIRTLSPLRLPVVQKPLAIAYGTSELPALRLSSTGFHAYRAQANAAGALIAVADRNHFTIFEELRRKDGILTRAILDIVR